MRDDDLIKHAFRVVECVHSLAISQLMLEGNRKLVLDAWGQATAQWNGGAATGDFEYALNAALSMDPVSVMGTSGGLLVELRSGREGAFFREDETAFQTVKSYVDLTPVVDSLRYIRAYTEKYGHQRV